MKKTLLGTAALLGGGLTIVPAFAEEPIRLTLGGHFNEVYMVVEDDNDPFELGQDRNRDGFFNDAEIDFTGTTVLDNGLEVGVQIELEGENDNDMVDEAYIWFAGGFGEIRIGSDDEALHKACVAPPGGSDNFSAFSPNQWASNDGLLFGALGGLSDNGVCTGVDDDHDAQKIIYTSPSFAGFMLTASYTPEENAETHDDGAGTHVGMPSHFPGQSRHNTSVALNYAYDAGSWGMEASLGGAWEGHVEEGTPGADIDIDPQDFYQAGVNFYFGNFAIGVAGEYYHDLSDIFADIGGVASEKIKSDAWVAGIGASYSYDAWVFGAQYSHYEGELEIDIDGFGGVLPFNQVDMQRDRVVGTVTYLLGPGMLLDAEVGYTWIDTDPEADFFSDQGNDVDDYQALEIGLGTTIVF